MKKKKCAWKSSCPTRWTYGTILLNKWYHKELFIFGHICHHRLQFLQPRIGIKTGTEWVYQPVMRISRRPPCNVRYSSNQPYQFSTQTSFRLQSDGCESTSPAPQLGPNPLLSFLLLTCAHNAKGLPSSGKKVVPEI